MSTTPQRDKRVRLSLECSAKVKREIEAHGKDLSEWSLIGTIRRAVKRSKALFDLEARGTLMLLRDEDGEVEDVEVPK